MAKPKLTEAQRVASEKMARGAERNQRAEAIKDNREKPISYCETYVLWKEVRSGDIVFPEPGSRPYVAAVDAIPSSGPIDGLTVIRDEQAEDHFYPSLGKTCVLRVFDPSEQVLEPEPEEKPPWEV